MNWAIGPSASGPLSTSAPGRRAAPSAALRSTSAASAEQAATATNVAPRPRAAMTTAATPGPTRSLTVSVPWMSEFAAGSSSGGTARGANENTTGKCRPSTAPMAATRA